MDSANFPECHTQFSRKDNMTRHYKYKHGKEHQLSPPPPPPPPPPHQKGEGLTPLPPAQESEGVKIFRAVTRNSHLTTSVHSTGDRVY